ncbi:oxygenase MpaB family protein [Pseudomonas yamanorum]|uniref:oxygenase MpaB family protein n=1 Tax=Pseudomonas yamanorum TaxID=515393 RepID=UPI003F75316B
MQAEKPATQERWGTPLPPDSLTWQYFGDLRGLLLISRVGLLQNLHPGLAAGVQQHSDLFNNPWNRLLRSIPPILGVVYDGDGAISTGRRVRDFHRHVKGTDDNGRAYHALSPELFYWAHATFFEGQIAVQALFGKPLDEATQACLYQESIQWYSLYGLPMTPVPADYAAFKKYWKHMLEQVLEPTDVARWYLAGNKAMPAPYPWLRGPLWWLLRPLFDRGARWLAIGTLPAELRCKLNLNWSARDQKNLKALALLVKGLWRIVPTGWRYFPQARRAFKRARLSARTLSK